MAAHSSTTKARNIVLILLGMSCSFTLVFGVMLSVHQPAKKQTPKRQRIRAVAEKVQPRGARQVPPKLEIERQPQIVSDADMKRMVEQETEDRARQNELELAQKEMQQQIALAKKELNRQIEELEKDRNRMIAQLASQLVDWGPKTAAQELSILDDETAAMVLLRMSKKPRLEVIQHLDPKRARRLENRLRRL